LYVFFLQIIIINELKLYIFYGLKLNLNFITQFFNIRILINIPDVCNILINNILTRLYGHSYPIILLKKKRLPAAKPIDDMAFL